MDLKEGGREVALKISRNKKFDFDNASIEINILHTLKKADPTDKQGVVKIIDSFPFRKHYVLVFELLDVNLYRYMQEIPNFKGMDRGMFKSVTLQMLQSLGFLREVGIIHCDLKPENILFTDSTKKNIKLIDFGSSCMNYKQGFSYVQSRYYRAPEIVLGLPYNQAADMWSFGCILIELKKGVPLFPALDESELMEMFLMIIGSPP